MQSNWSWVVASYLLTTAALAGYVLYLRGRVREAERTMHDVTGGHE